MLSDKTFRLRLTSSLRNQYPYLLMAGAGVRRRMRGLVNGSSGQQNISQNQIRSLQVARPPVPEQERNERVVEEVEGRIERESHHLDKLRTLKHRLMDDLLTGRVRGPVSGEAPV